jgi:hypothetical protein
VCVSQLIFIVAISHIVLVAVATTITQMLVRSWEEWEVVRRRVVTVPRALCTGTRAWRWPCCCCLRRTVKPLVVQRPTPPSETAAVNAARSFALQFGIITPSVYLSLRNWFLRKHGAVVASDSPPAVVK